MRRVALSLIFIFSVIVLGAMYTEYALQKRVGKLYVHELSSPSAEASARPALPFFELMVPLPLDPGLKYIPQLEYRKGPPKRFLSKIAYLLIPEGEKREKEQIVYYGRRTQEYSWHSLATKLTGTGTAESTADFIANAIRFAADGKFPPGTPWYNEPLLSLVYLKQLSSVVSGETQDVYILSQSGSPAFLFYPRHRATIGENATAWFFRRNTLYEIQFRSQGKFSVIDPVDLFSHSFLVEKRREALSYIASELSEVNLKRESLQKLSLADLQWPLLLLGAKLSVDPASIHAFFHFAGLNALLFNTFRGETDDLDVIDSFRNNVLVADRYGKDIAPDSAQSGEMSRLARRLIDML